MSYANLNEWVRRDVHDAEVEQLRTALAKIADKAKYLSEPAWTPEGCAIVGQQIYRWAADALAGKGRSDA